MFQPHPMMLQLAATPQKILARLRGSGFPSRIRPADVTPLASSCNPQVRRICGVSAASVALGLLTLSPHPLMAQPTTTPSVQPATAPTAADSPRSLIQFGSEGAAVEQLQAILQLLGFYSGPIDGVYQASTVNAVRDFQQAAGITVDGIVGPSTWDKLLPALPQSRPAAATQPPAARPASATTTPASSTTQPSTSQPTTTRPSTTAAPSASGSAPRTDVNLPILRLGMTGSAVSRLQERLAALGFYQGAVDGIFGAQTESAVKVAQRNFSLEDDGVVGPATWAALLR